MSADTQVPYVESLPCSLRKFKTIWQQSSKLSEKRFHKILVWDAFWMDIHCCKSSHGLYSLSGKTSYRKISWSIEAARFRFRIFQSLWNLTGTLAAALRDACQISERYAHNNIQSRGFQISRDLAVRRLTASWIEAQGIIRYDGLLLNKSMAWCKTAVSPLLTHWRYCSHALSQQNIPHVLGSSVDYPGCAELFVRQHKNIQCNDVITVFSKDPHRRHPIAGEIWGVFRVSTLIYILPQSLQCSM